MVPGLPPMISMAAPFALGLLPRFHPPMWNDDGVYIQIAGEGFVGQYGGSGTAHTMERTLRSFCGLSIAMRLCKVEHEYSLFSWRPTAIVHRQAADGTWLPITHYELNDSISRGLAGLKLHDLGGSLDTDSKRQAWAQHKLRDIAVVFGSEKRADQIKLASQWLFDATRDRTRYCRSFSLWSYSKFSWAIN
jgi:hypothetical protein